MPFVIPENAILSEVDFYVGQNISIRCREGYQLKGQSVITCNADETWTPATAKCESKYTRYSSAWVWYFPEGWWPQLYHTEAWQHRHVSRALHLDAVILEEESFCLLLPFGEVGHYEIQAHKGDLRSSTEELFLLFFLTVVSLKGSRICLWVDAPRAFALLSTRPYCNFLLSLPFASTGAGIGCGIP